VLHCAKLAYGVMCFTLQSFGLQARFGEGCTVHVYQNFLWVENWRNLERGVKSSDLSPCITGRLASYTPPLNWRARVNPWYTFPCQNWAWSVYTVAHAGPNNCNFDQIFKPCWWSFCC